MGCLLVYDVCDCLCYCECGERLAFISVWEVRTKKLCCTHMRVCVSMDFWSLVFVPLLLLLLFLHFTINNWIRFCWVLLFIFAGCDNRILWSVYCNSKKFMNAPKNFISLLFDPILLVLKNVFFIHLFFVSEMMKHFFDFLYCFCLIFENGKYLVLLLLLRFHCDILWFFYYLFIMDHSRYFADRGNI